MGELSYHKYTPLVFASRRGEPGLVELMIENEASFLPQEDKQKFLSMI
jgi:hypothetical protein